MDELYTWRVSRRKYVIRTRSAYAQTNVSERRLSNSVSTPGRRGVKRDFARRNPPGLTTTTSAVLWKGQRRGPRLLYLRREGRSPQGPCRLSWTVIDSEGTVVVRRGKSGAQDPSLGTVKRTVDGGRRVDRNFTATLHNTNKREKLLGWTPCKSKN